MIHPFEPVFDSNSRILILGTFPSVKSREHQFYYGHPQNRFWKVLAAVYKDAPPKTVPEKKAFLLKHCTALWDVISSCEITGSADASIKNAVPNDISKILGAAHISRIFCNGTKAFDLYNKYLLPKTEIQAEKLPSTSPANAAWTLEKLTAAWQVISLAT